MVDTRVHTSPTHGQSSEASRVHGVIELLEDPAHLVVGCLQLTHRILHVCRVLEQVLRRMNRPCFTGRGSESNAALHLQ